MYTELRTNISYRDSTVCDKGIHGRIFRHHTRIESFYPDIENQTIDLD
ncbi:hypothetical protein K788_00000295 [Paraburkholderia caribensis MBA4]|uniref:Uncharacterized protein n=1 Tax=Paraburkholderia caribensis MBA4 TaxID=1323664 RepID=A0A0N7JVD9_9BURK|nr:hypothetical protein K788_00000295 [Paraburkholderia caribensis MBA4]